MLVLVKLCGCVHLLPTHSFWHPQILLSVFWLLFEEEPPWSVFLPPFFPPSPVSPVTEFRTCDGELLFSLCPQIPSPFAFCLGSNHLTLGIIGCWVLYFPLKKVNMAYVISGRVKTLRNQENWSQEWSQLWLLKRRVTSGYLMELENMEFPPLSMSGFESVSFEYERTGYSSRSWNRFSVPL